MRSEIRDIWVPRDGVRRLLGDTPERELALVGIESEFDTEGNLVGIGYVDETDEVRRMLEKLGPYIGA